MSFEDKLYPLLGLYYNLPQPIASLVGKVYRNIPNRFTLGGDYAQFEDISKGTSIEYINSEFLNTLKAARETVFYQELFASHGIRFSEIKSIDDLSRVPTISKQDVKDNLDKMINPKFARFKMYLTTGGSTGTPVGFYLHKGISRVKETAFINQLWETCGYRQGDRMAIVRGLQYKTKDGFSRLDPIKNALMLSSYYLTDDHVKSYVDKLNLFKPKFIQAYPSSIYLLSRLMKSHSLELDFCPKRIFCGSENLYPDQVAVIESVFKADVFSWYGHTERVLLGKRLADNSYSFIPQYGIPELLNEDGKTIKKGTGELCGTSLHNFVMPLLRYRTQDLATLSDTPNNIGSEFVVSNIEGRAQEFVYSNSQRPVSMTAINMHDDVFDNIERFQFHQDSYGYLTFNYTSRREISERQFNYIEKKLMNKLGEGFMLRVRKVDEIGLTKNGKQSFLIQKLKIV